MRIDMTDFMVKAARKLLVEALNDFDPVKAQVRDGDTDWVCTDDYEDYYTVNGHTYTAVFSFEFDVCRQRLTGANGMPCGVAYIIEQVKFDGYGCYDSTPGISEDDEDETCFDKQAVEAVLSNL